RRLRSQPSLQRSHHCIRICKLRLQCHHHQRSHRLQPLTHCLRKLHVVLFSGHESRCIQLPAYFKNAFDIPHPVRMMIRESHGIHNTTARLPQHHLKPLRPRDRTERQWPKPCTKDEQRSREDELPPHHPHLRSFAHQFPCASLHLIELILTNHYRISPSQRFKAFTQIANGQQRIPQVLCSHQC